MKGLTPCDSFVDVLHWHTPTWEDQILELKKLFHRIQDANLINLQSARSESRALTVGNHARERVMKSEEEKILNVLFVPASTTKKQLRSFLGFIGYYSKYIPNFSTIAALRSDLTRNGQPNKVVWQEPH